MAAEWREYQEQAAAFFRSIGMQAETDVTLQGVRTKHDVDVFVRSHHVGFEAIWIVECKRWSKPVTKLHVLGLREIVHDVGADKGIMLAENGFQEGAHEAATLTNVQLTSLRELEETSRQEVYAMRFRDLFERSDNCDYSYWELPKDFRIDVGLRPDTAEDGYSTTVALKVVRLIVQEAMRDKYPVIVGGFSRMIQGLPERLENPEQAYTETDKILTDLEGRLSAAQVEWNRRNPN